MLQGFLARYAQSCHLADRSDPATMANLRAILAPRLRGHMRELVTSLRRDRRSSRPLPGDVRRDLVLEALECREAIRAAQKVI
ncbi:hypothetical protein [Methylibium petroleiphilum]|uniref:Uncharacterized protein n=1 Tax=Methylibium petroleiphilum (strain ATCC BAA-1232 / LMG 22953 / PM1) TaxID=420662 RepID=A2SMY0_METPP|nr:hypothetical protein [Methylibium petroleiphilum]ABM96919.1 hypothetical protein Mpe_B0141 [Methylibium petroleiphilum PM1]